jgi:hypothetical protein
MNTLAPDFLKPLRLGLSQANSGPDFENYPVGDDYFFQMKETNMNKKQTRPAPMSRM